MNIRKLFQSDPFGVNLEVTQEFIDEDFDQTKKSQPHTDRLYPTAQQNEIIENEQT